MSVLQRENDRHVAVFRSGVYLEIRNFIPESWAIRLMREWRPLC
jgi:hypothetical protein